MMNMCSKTSFLGTQLNPTAGCGRTEISPIKTPIGSDTESFSNYLLFIWEPDSISRFPVKITSKEVATAQWILIYEYRKDTERKIKQAGKEEKR
jgi:hypothetical protein